MYESITSKLMSCPDDQISTCNEVVVTYKVGCAADDRNIFMGFTGETEDIRSLFLDLAECFSCSRNCLVDNDGLHLGIICKTYDYSDCSLLLVHEVVWVSDMLDDSAILDRTVLGNKSFSASQVVFTLGNCTSDDSNMKIIWICCRCLFCCTICKYKGHREENGENYNNCFFHNSHSLFLING